MDWTFESIYEDTNRAVVNVICPSNLDQKTLNNICSAVDEFDFKGKRVEMVLFTWPTLEEFIGRATTTFDFVN